MSKKIKSVETGYDIDVKRFYLPEIKGKCPKCGNEISFLGDNYLSYPSVNKKETSGGYCEKCELDLFIEVEVKINIEYDDENVKID